MSTEADERGSTHRGNFTPRVHTDAGTRGPGGVADAIDEDLAARVRALRAEMPRRGVGAGFPDVVRARARRHRSRARVAAAALVLVIVAGVGIPVSLRTGGNDSVSTAATTGTASRAVLHTFGGVSVTWLPAAMTFDADLSEVIAFEAEAPWIASDVDALRGSAFVSRFVAPSASSAPAAAGLSTVWVTAIWSPSNDPAAMSTSRVRQRLESQPNPGRDSRWDSTGVTEVSATTVGGQDATFVRNDLAIATEAAALGRTWDPDHRYGGLLVWPTASGTLLAVEADGPAPVDLEVLRQIGAGLVLGAQPSIGPKPAGSPRPLEDTETAAAVEAVVHDVFAHGVPDERWAAAMEDGQALTAVRAKVRARFPQLSDTLDVTVDSLSQSGPDWVSARITLSFIDPTAPRAGQVDQDGRTRFSTVIAAIRTADGWKVARQAYCATVTWLGESELVCPHA